MLLRRFPSLTVLYVLTVCCVWICIWSYYVLYLITLSPFFAKIFVSRRFFVISMLSFKSLVDSIRTGIADGKIFFSQEPWRKRRWYKNIFSHVFCIFTLSIAVQNDYILLNLNHCRRFFGRWPTIFFRNDMMIRCHNKGGFKYASPLDCLNVTCVCVVCIFIFLM